MSRPTIQELQDSSDDDIDDRMKSKNKKPSSTKSPSGPTSQRKRSSNGSGNTPSYSNSGKTIIEEPDSDEDTTVRINRKTRETTETTAHAHTVPEREHTSVARPRNKSFRDKFSAFGRDMISDMMNHMNRVMSHNHLSLFDDDDDNDGDDIFGSAHRHHHKMMSSFSKSMGNFGDFGSLGDDDDDDEEYDSRGNRRRKPHHQKSVFYSSTTSITSANGVTEMKKAMKDSRTGTEKVSVQRKIGDKAITVEKVSDKTGREQTTKKLENVTEEDERNFEKEWFRVSGQLPQWYPSSSSASASLTASSGHHQSRRNNGHLALEDTVSKRRS